MRIARVLLLVLALAPAAHAQQKPAPVPDKPYTYLLYAQPGSADIIQFYPYVDPTLVPKECERLAKINRMPVCSLSSPLSVSRAFKKGPKGYPLTCLEFDTSSSYTSVSYSIGSTHVIVITVRNNCEQPVWVYYQDSDLVRAWHELGQARPEKVFSFIQQSDRTGFGLVGEISVCAERLQPVFNPERCASRSPARPIFELYPVTDRSPSKVPDQCVVEDWSSRGCPYFTRPLEEEGGGVYRMNRYAEGATMCNRGILYTCDGRLWKKAPLHVCIDHSDWQKRLACATEQGTGCDDLDMTALPVCASDDKRRVPEKGKLNEDLSSAAKPKPAATPKPAAAGDQWNAILGDVLRGMARRGGGPVAQGPQPQPQQPPDSGGKPSEADCQRMIEEGRAESQRIANAYGNDLCKLMRAQQDFYRRTAVPLAQKCATPQAVADYQRGIQEIEEKYFGPKGWCTQQGKR